MQFVADESVDAPIVHKLRESGHQVWAIAEESPGIEDEKVLSVALERQCPLITQDKDFGELVFRLEKVHYGVILLRLSGIKPMQKAFLCDLVVNTHLQEIWLAFTVIYKDVVKIRKKQLP